MKKIYLLFGVLLINKAIGGIELKEKVKEYKLENGLRVICVERRASPTFAAITLFPVGRIDEPKGKGGIAHLVEHMLFRGTKTIGSKDWEKESILIEKLDSLGSLIITEKSKSAFDSSLMKKLEQEFAEIQEEAAKYGEVDPIFHLYITQGATHVNAFTSYEATCYYGQLPSNKIELWVRITADIIENSTFRGFYKEKSVVINEIKMRKDEPETMFWEEFNKLAFTRHPYGKSIAGEVDDVEKLTIKDMKDFYNKYYTLSNAIIVVVGDVHFEELKKLIDKYFNHFPYVEPYKPDIEEEPQQTEERRKTIKLDAEPRISIAYHIPTYPNFDYYVLEIISEILSTGRTSRLYKSMVDKKIATEVYTSVGNPGIRYANLFEFTGLPIYPHTTEEIENIFYQEIEKLKTDPVDEIELKKVKNQIKANFLRNMQHNRRLGLELAYFEGFFGGWRLIEDYIKMIDKVSPDHIIEVANKYFKKENRVVLNSIKNGEEKKLIDIAVEYYKQKTGEAPNNETTNMLNEMINQMEKLEETKKLSIPKEQKIQAIKQAIDALTEGEK